MCLTTQRFGAVFGGMKKNERLQIQIIPIQVRIECFMIHHDISGDVKESTYSSMYDRFVLQSVLLLVQYSTQYSVRYSFIVFFRSQHIINYVAVFSFESICDLKL